uniref:CSON015213 protein n=1 Tax=Culicoides sonorensis TaxID=179676 RepID=A0A336KUE9_CULSO
MKLKIFLLSCVIPTIFGATVIPPTSPAPPKLDVNETQDEQKSKELPNHPINNNPAFDPSMYQNFVPQDAVQQYVSQYSSGPTYPAAGPYPTYTEALIPSFESIIIPATALETKQEPVSSFSGLLDALGPVIRTLFGIVSKIGGTLLSIAGVVIFGGLITSLFCAFTPFCRISFLETPVQALKNNTMEAIDKMGTEITTERIRRAAEFVTAAIEKFENLQKLARVSKAYK